MSKWLEQFKQHAKEHPGFEVCALVVQKGRKRSLVTCINEHEHPHEKFRISAEEWAEAEESGDVVMVLHSHPGEAARPIPSDLDRQQCNESGVAWGIYAPDCDEYAELQPEETPMIGRPFILGSWDCYGLVIDWHAKQGITIPDFRVNYPWWEQGENLYMDNWQSAGFVECDEMTPGSVVIMQVEASVPNHAGVVTEDGQLLHHLYGKPSCVIPFKAGYFRERAVIFVRHKDLPEEIRPWR